MTFFVAGGLSGIVWAHRQLVWVQAGADKTREALFFGFHQV